MFSAVNESLLAHKQSCILRKIFGSRDFVTMIGYIIAPIIGGYVWEAISPQAPFIISVFVEFSLIPVFLLGIALVKPYIAEFFIK